jgi:hypothetical protein
MRRQGEAQVQAFSASTGRGAGADAADVPGRPRLGGAVPAAPRRRAGLPAPGARSRAAGPADLVGELRREVAEARQVASKLASAVRYLRGDRGVEAVLRREQPWWLVAR